ncbi:MAG TPA: phosphotransferase family protein [Acidimicrobiales bacterium]|nr:phosphotransferase family protein [Acidimicrobiales bacterium]
MTQEDLPEQLGAALAPVLGSAVVVEDLARAPGGASRETWIFTAKASDGTRHRLVLRRDPAGAPPSGLGLEGDLLRAAHRMGVPVPEVLVVGDADAVLGAGSLIMRFIEGETIPRKILRDESLESARAQMAAQCGRVLAAIHRIPPHEVPGLPGGDPVEQLRAIVDRLGQPHPAFELAFRWLGDNRPPRSSQGVVHGDFRNGNLIVGSDGIRAVLDWELAHLGDPLEDLGWLCVKAWRFGSALPVGGFGSVDQLVRAYEESGGTTVDGAALHWWEVLGTLRWGVICIVQMVTHLTGTLRSVELAAIGRRVCEVEWDLLELLTGERLAADAPLGAQGSGDTVSGADVPVVTLHDAPSAAELLAAVGEFLAGDVMACTDGRLRFHARVAANVVAMVVRELSVGPRQASEHAARLAGLAVADEADLAGAIRSGRLDDRSAEVYDVVRATVAAKLAVAHPGYGR